MDFVDIEPSTGLMSMNKLIEKLKNAEIEKKLPKVIIPVHLAGTVCEMEKLHDLSKIYNFKIIEDASHAIGAKYNNENVGNCRYSDITVFSFHPVKIITTGEGGMALTNDKKLEESIRRLSTHGITKDKSIMSPRSMDEIWNYQQIQLGFNYRMNDLQAALGLSQLKRLDKYVTRRHEIAAYYNFKLEKLPIVIPWQLPKTFSSYHLYPICIKEDSNKELQKKIYNNLIKNQIAANLHYIPIHRHPYYEKLGFKEGDFLESEKFHRKAISLPIFPLLKEDQSTKVVNVISEALREDGN